MNFGSILFKIGSLLLLLSASNALSTVKLKQISTEDGLNQSNITSLMQDEEGYLWISSLQGVNRYDGYRVLQVESPDKILVNSYIETVFQDSLGKIWIGASPDINFILDKQNNSLEPFKFPSNPDKPLVAPTLNRLAEDDKTNLWMATYLDIFYFDRAKNNYEHVLNLGSVVENEDLEQSIRHIKIIRQFLFIATTKGLFKMDLKDRSITPVIHTPQLDASNDARNVKYLLVDHEGSLLVGTVEGMFKIGGHQLFDPTLNGKPIGQLIVKQLNIWAILEGHNFYWLGTDKGLYQLQLDGDLTEIVKFSDTPFDTSDDDIVSLIEDKEGNLWMGSRADGVFKYSPNLGIKAHYWHKSKAGKKLSNDTVYAVHQTKDGRVLVGTQNGLNILEPESKKITQTLVNLDEKAVFSESSIYQVLSNKSEIWLSTARGIKTLNSETLQPNNRLFPKTEKDIFNKAVTSLHFFDSKTLGIVTTDGLYHYDLEKNSVSFIESSATNEKVELRMGAIFEAATGDRETYFIGGIDRLVKYEKNTGQFSDFHTLPPSDNYRTMPADVKRVGDQIWVTYSGFGLYVLDARTGEELKFISEADLGTNTIMDMFDGDAKHIWMMSNDGLIRINKATYNARVFDTQDGFATSEFNGGAIEKLSNGDVYLGSIKGLFHFSPNQMGKSQSRKIDNHITSLNLLSREVSHQYGDYNDSTLTLTHKDFGIKVAFSPLLLGKPDQVKFRYWFEGDAATESNTIKSSELFLPTIEEGKSTLNISAIDYETGFESKPAQIKIISLPPPWFSRQAYIVYVILILSVSLNSFYRYRKRAKAKKRSLDQLKQSEERLSLALKGGNSGLWDWHAIDNRIYEPRIEYSNNQSGDKKINFEERLESIHPDDREKFQRQWKDFLGSELKAFDIVYRMKKGNDEWAWYRDMATVSEQDQFNQPIRVTGTFTDITERKEARDKMRLFSTAFESTHDIVFVLNNEKETIAANPAFYQQTEYEVGNIIGEKMKFLTDAEGNLKLVAEVFKSLYLQSQWSGEGLLVRNFKKPLPVLINATSFKGIEEKDNFVFALTDISKQKVAENQLRKLANYDSLTGLPNRALLLDRVAHAIEHCRRREQQLALFFIDLDRFKQVNDTLGHDIGDLLLIEVAKTLIKSVRHDDTVARLGGDEFIVMLEDIDNLDAINRIAKNIIEEMQHEMMLKGHAVLVSPSIGIAIYPNDGDDSSELLKNADIAMYHAKNAGRNNFQYFENSMNHTAKVRLGFESMMRKGLAQNEFFLMYQPQYDLKTDQINGVEALARWRMENGELVSPMEFIPVAEEIGLIIPMTEILLNEAVSSLSLWHQQSLNLSLAFNLSAKHLHHFSFVEFVESLLAKHTINASLLEFELTESVLMQDMEKANRIFGKLETYGIELALDDFGTGYSSLKYLNQLPINKLKIDRSFVDKIGVSHDNDMIIKTIISLAQSLGLKTVAEGIETESQLKFLRQAGVDQAQGFYLSKPLMIDDLNELLKS